jgi:hypothetical protein
MPSSLILGLTEAAMVEGGRAFTRLAAGRDLSAGFADAKNASIRNEVMGYARRVATVEWPEQAEGRMVEQDSVNLDGLNRMALGKHASDDAVRDLRIPTPIPI